MLSISLSITFGACCHWKNIVKKGFEETVRMALRQWLEESASLKMLKYRPKPWRSNLLPKILLLCMRYNLMLILQLPKMQLIAV
uniref:Uncharacterized protein n=1 Tax=Utricularia reniformis TaxID=192314 RepID=A0A1Y0AYU6_9LAMI|nr:hypothetical protein AEK19_MT0929 [Utricularia reniformis]ART30332.1 hypothetical protein AEK19_MT0929 [Utricularia reniformis]